MSQSSYQNRDKAFETLVSAAVRRDRCPENGTHGIRWDFLSALASAGCIRIEISGRNFRRVTILTGPHAGKATAPDPAGAKPWKIIDASGTRSNGRLTFPSKDRQQPSAPRPLTNAELYR
jgi:hypothetical protein